MEPTRALLASLGDPHREFPSLHIGGTNGKGSVVTLCAAALRVAGWRVGVYTSPHLVSVRERMMVDGCPIPEEAFAAWTARLAPAIERCGASFFEATTAIAFADFAARGVDIAVIEVGLGGRLDATNVVTPLVSGVITVGLDHRDYLGDTLEAIAREKAGIAKAGVPFVIGECRPAIRDVLMECAIAAGAVPVVVSAERGYGGALGLDGEHQRRNAAVAEALLEQLPPPYRPDARAVALGFAGARLAGRFDRRGRWIFDVAHNPDGFRTLVGALRQAAPPRPLHGLVAILSDKDWGAMLELLLPELDCAVVTVAPSAPGERRWSLPAVGDRFGDRVRVEPDFDAALAGAGRGAATVLVTGSFHTVGDALGRLPGFAPLG